MRHALATIDLGALRRNLQRVRARVGSSRILAVVKADAYGHGLERVVQALRDADGFGVAGLEDARRIRLLERRKGWVARPVVLLSGFDESQDLDTIHRLALDAVIHDSSQVAMLRANPRQWPRCLWIKLDTGMHRLGFALDQLPALQASLAGPGTPVVWMSHLADADGLSTARTERQIRVYFEALGTTPGLRSLANSAAVLRHPQAHLDWVRPGGVLYGLSTVAGQSGSDLGFEPVMRLCSRIVAVRQVPCGGSVGYGEGQTLVRDTRLGVVSIGYGDGYPRHVSGAGGWVWVDGQRAPILGRVSMDLLTVDLTDLPGADIGTDVELWGPQVPAELVAAWAGSISYELTCGVTRRVQFAEHQETSVVHAR